MVVVVVLKVAGRVLGQAIVSRERTALENVFDVLKERERLAVRPSTRCS